MATLAQLEANRRNALKSTGPRTAEGKQSSRRNAIKHGLAAETLILPEEEAEAVAARIVAWTPSLRPVGEYDDWLVEEIAVSSVRIDRCRDHETSLRTLSARRASLCWDHDRAIQADDLGAKLGKKPSSVSRKLRATKQGCDWLIARWEHLAGALETKAGWDEAQKKMALDLLGTPAEFRKGPSALDGDRSALVAGQLAEIGAFRSGAMEELDELERSAAEVGLGNGPDKMLALVRRYEAASVRRFERAMKQVGKGKGQGRPIAIATVAVEAARVVPAPAKTSTTSPSWTTPPPPECEFESDEEAEEFLRMVEEMECEGVDLDALLAEMKSAPAPVPVVAPKQAAPAGNRRSRRARKAMARRG